MQNARKHLLRAVTAVFRRFPDVRDLCYEAANITIDEETADYIQNVVVKLKKSGWTWAGNKKPEVES